MRLLKLVSAAAWRHFPLSPLLHLFPFGFLLAVLAIACASPALAQIANLTVTNIGSGSGGTYNPSTGGLSGTGIGITGTTDNFVFANTPTTSNIEIEANVSALSGTSLSGYSVAGLMVRDSLAPNAATALVSVSPANGVNFTVRTADGAAATTTLGPTLTGPIYLRLVVSGTSVAAYESSDNSNWVLVGRSTIVMPTVYYAGLAIASNSSTNSCSTTVSPGWIFTAVPQRSSNMLLWLRSDANVQTSAGSVSTWVDQSGNGINATSSGSNPTFPATSPINGLPVVNFNSSSLQYLNLGAGFSDFSQGYTSFVVVNCPSTPQGGSIRIVNLASSTTTANGLNIIEPSTTTGALQVYAAGGGTPTGASTSLSTGTHLLAFSQSGTTATGYTDGVAGTPNTSMIAISSNARTQNFLAKYGGDTTHNFNGNLAEVLIFNTQLSATQIQGVQNYLAAKWGVSYSLTPPAMTPQYAVATTAQSVTLTPPPGAVAYYSINGGSYQIYTQPFTITAAQMVSGKATITTYSVEPGLANSSTVTGAIQIDPNAAPLLQSSLQAWYRADLGAPTSGNVATWYDVSGKGMNATQATSTKQPTITTGPNSLPALNFDGANDSLGVGASTGFSDLTHGCSMFIVTNPATEASGNYRMLWLGVTGTTSDQVTLDQTSTTGWRGLVYNGAASSTVSATNLSQTYQILSSVYDGVSTSTLYRNSVQAAQNTAMQTTQNVSRIATLGAYNNGTTAWFQGGIAEIVILNSAVTQAQRQAIEGYLAHKYSLYVNAPTITPASGVYTATPQTVTIAADTGASVYVTLDGTDPRTSGTRFLYTAPFTLSNSASVSAVAVQSFQTSSVTTNYIVADSSVGSIPTNGLYAWFRSDVGPAVNGSSQVTSWQDLSFTGHNLTGGATLPTRLTNAVNGLPAVNFGAGASMNVGGTAANFTQGFSAFLLNQAVSNTGGYWLNFVDATNTYYCQLLPSGTYGWTMQFRTNSTFSAAGGARIPSVYQLTESLEGNSLGNLFVNGSNVDPNAAWSNQTNTALPGVIGGGSTAAWPAAELLLYTRQVSAAERGAIENYMLSRYGLTGGAIATPTFSIPTATSFAAPTQVAIASSPGATIYVTTDGSTPSSTHYNFIYSAPILVTYTTPFAFQAIAVKNGVSSSVATSPIYTLDATKWPAPNASDTNAPRINLQVPTPAQ